jgi:hypothetical protein
VNWKILFSKFGSTKPSTEKDDDFNPWLPLQWKLGTLYPGCQARSARIPFGKPIDFPPNLWWLTDFLVPEFEKFCESAIGEFAGDVDWNFFTVQRGDGRFFLRIAPERFKKYMEEPFSEQNLQELRQKYPWLTKFSYIHVREKEFAASTGSYCSEALVDVPRLVDTLLKYEPQQ